MTSDASGRAEAAGGRVTVTPARICPFDRPGASLLDGQGAQARPTGADDGVMLRAGVLGAGVMGGHHARSYAHFPSRVELVGVFDPDAARAQAVAERYDARAYTDVEALLGDVDVVTIASPSGLHVEHALLALEHGCDVLVEKPVALDA